MISKATISDIPKVAFLMEAFYVEEGYVFDKANILTSLNEFLSNYTLGSIFLIAKDEAIMGYLIIVNTFCFELGGRIGYLDELFVLKRYRGNSLGFKLLSYVTSLYKEDNFSALRLEVEHSHTRVAEFYKRIGFKPHNRYLMSHSLINPSSD